MGSKSKVSAPKAARRVQGSQSPKVDDRPKAGEPAGTLVAALTDHQRAALVAIASGQSFSEAARSAGISRQTIYNWRQSSPPFVAALNAWQSATRASAHNRLIGLSDLAVDAVSGAIQKGDVRVAMDLLRTLGILAPSQPGPCDPAEVEEQAFADKARRESAQVNTQALVASTAISRNFI